MSTSPLGATAFSVAEAVHKPSGWSMREQFLIQQNTLVVLSKLGTCFHFRFQWFTVCLFRQGLMYPPVGWNLLYNQG